MATDQAETQDTADKGPQKTTKDVFKQAHQAAMKKAKPHLPKTDITQIIQEIDAVAKKKKSPIDAAKEIAADYQEPAAIYAKAFAAVAIDEMLQQVQVRKFSNLAGTDFSSQLVDSAVDIGQSIHQYFDGKIDSTKLIEQLGNSGIKKIGKDVWNAADFKLSDVKIPNIKMSEVKIPDMHFTPDKIVDIAVPVMAYAALMEAYAILRKALDDEATAYEERLHIESECQKSIVLIQKYHTEMETAVSQYLSKNINTFNAGFSAMDQAILANDSDGFIKGNVEIQKVLSYHSQFSNQQEFDDLMDSDTAFKL